MVFDKSLWPCFTPDLFWALSDPITKCGEVKLVEDDVVEYEIQTSNLPDGKIGLWRFNALRDIKITLAQWPSKLRSKIQSATLCLGDKALEEIICGPHSSYDDGEDIKFTMFSKESILPLFVVDEDSLSVRIMFRPALTDNERLQVPSKSVDALGLLVRVQDTKKAFFVAGCSDSILSWDGQQSRVVSKHLIEKCDSDEMSENSEEGHFLDPIARWNVVNSDNATFEDMWSSLQTESKELPTNTTTFFMPTPRE